MLFLALFLLIFLLQRPWGSTPRFATAARLVLKWRALLLLFHLILGDVVQLCEMITHAHLQMELASMNRGQRDSEEVRRLAVFNAEVDDIMSGTYRDRMPSKLYATQDQFVERGVAEHLVKHFGAQKQLSTPPRGSRP